MEKENIFSKLNKIDVSKHIEKKGDLSYLSWSWAWQQIKTNIPDASYKVREWNDKPYLFDEVLGYMVETSVTINGETISMRLPVMDSKNKSQKDKDYEITYESKKGSYSIKVLAATMFDINTAIMRCLVKNLAMFGLGLYIYAGEDIPCNDISKDDAQKEIENANTVEELNSIWSARSAQFGNDSDYRNMWSSRKKMIVSKSEIKDTPKEKITPVEIGKIPQDTKSVAIKNLALATTVEQINKMWDENKTLLGRDVDYKSAWIARKQMIISMEKQNDKIQPNENFQQKFSNSLL